MKKELIRKRVKAGIANAREKGKRRGRKPLPPIVIKQVIDAYEQAPDSALRAIADIADVSAASAGRILKDYREWRYDRDGFRYERPLVEM